jgi:hypothetical protein
MATAAILTVMMLVLLAVNFRGFLMSGRKQLTWLYVLCFAASLAMLVLNSLDVYLYGPSQWIWDLVRALGLVKS